MINALRRKGIPLSLYSDQHAIFHPPKGKLTLRTGTGRLKAALSTFGQAIPDLGITHIEALSPQAKGRIERLFVTLQDRWVIELRLRGVSTPEEANQVLPGLIEKHNQLFADAPKDTDSACRPLPKTLLDLHLSGVPAHEHRVNLLLERRVLYAQAGAGGAALGTQKRGRSQGRRVE